MNCAKICNAAKCRKRAHFRCGYCSCAFYCSTACQARDWELQHKHLCIHHQDYGDEDTSSLLLMVELFSGKVPWHYILRDHECLRRFVRGSLLLGAVIQESGTGRRLTLEIFDRELTTREQQETVRGLVVSLMSDMLTDEGRVEQALSKIPLKCHKCMQPEESAAKLTPDRNLAGLLFLCRSCHTTNEITIDFDNIKWKQSGIEHTENLPSWVSLVL